MGRCLVANIVAFVFCCSWWPVQHQGARKVCRQQSFWPSWREQSVSCWQMCCHVQTPRPSSNSAWTGQETKHHCCDWSSIKHIMDRSEVTVLTGLYQTHHGQVRGHCADWSSIKHSMDRSEVTVLTGLQSNTAWTGQRSLCWLAFNQTQHGQVSGHCADWSSIKHSMDRSEVTVLTGLQ